MSEQLQENIISKDEVRKVASLARIELSEKEESSFANEINSILDYFKDLSSVQVDELRKVDHYEMTENIFKSDEVIESSGGEKDGIKKIFPVKEGDFLEVKTVLKK